MIITDQSLLRTPCVDVLPDEVFALKEKLEQELKSSNAGIGLAAPQIGIYKKMAIVRIAGTPNVDLINCRIDKGYDEIVVEEEGCLSFRDLWVKTRRYREIYIVENMHYRKSMILTGMLSIAAQHELDHLQGILLPDVANAVKIKRNY